MASTTNGFSYPDGTDPADVPYWNEQLAQNVDDAVGAWADFTPILYTAMGTTPTAISATVSYGRYKRVGKLVIAQAAVTANAATTGGCGISLPVTARDRIIGAGTLAAWGATTPADQSGQAYMAADKVKLVIAAYTQGFRDIVSGAVVRYSVIYEAA